jgi:hypothetical protein
VFASIAHIESATLVTMDAGFAKHVGHAIDILDLNDSLTDAVYRERFSGETIHG